MKLAPVVLFAYKRAALTKEVLEALSQNELADESVLFVFCDGPRAGDTAENLEKIRQTRLVVREKKWCGTVNVIERDTNFGLAKSVIEGVTQIVEEHGAVIVLEDDIKPSPFFLRYMNDALKMYEGESSVFSIGACNFFAKGNEVPETFFIRIPDCWGWATWKDRWRMFEQDGLLLHQQLSSKGLMKDFNLSGVFNFERMLLDQIEGKNNSWAIRWQAVAYLYGMLSLYPRLSVVKNLGFGNEATHGGSESVFGNTLLANRAVEVVKTPIATNALVEREMLNTYSRLNMPAARSLRSKLNSLLNKLAR